MNYIHDAILGNTDMETALNREVLKAAVMRQIMCRRSGAVLDVRSAVYFKVELRGRSAAEVIDGAMWDAIADKITTSCEAQGAAIEVIDGREINARHRSGR